MPKHGRSYGKWHAGQLIELRRRHGLGRPEGVSPYCTRMAFNYGTSTLGAKAYANRQGTSFAAPYISGSLDAAAKPSLTPAAAKAILGNTATRTTGKRNPQHRRRVRRLPVPAALSFQDAYPQSAGAISTFPSERPFLSL